VSSAVRVEVPRRKDFVKVALQAAADRHHSAVVPASTEQSFADFCCATKFSAAWY